MSERLKDNIAKGLDEQSKMVRYLPKPTSDPTLPRDDHCKLMR